MTEHRYKFKVGDIVRYLDSETYAIWNEAMTDYDYRELFDTLFIVKVMPAFWWSDGSHYYVCSSIEIEGCHPWSIKESMMRLVEAA